MPGPVEKTKYFFSYTIASLALGCIRRSLGNTSTDEIIKEGKAEPMENQGHMMNGQREGKA